MQPTILVLHIIPVKSIKTNWIPRKVTDSLCSLSGRSNGFLRLSLYLTRLIHWDKCPGNSFTALRSCINSKHGIMMWLLSRRIVKCTGDVRNVRKSRCWLLKFHNGNFNLSDAPRSSTSHIVKTAEEISSTGTVPSSLARNWESVQARQTRCKRIVAGKCSVQPTNICTPLTEKQISLPFLNLTVTGDERWYTTIQKIGRQWFARGAALLPCSGPDVHPRRILQRPWCNLNEIVSNFQQRIGTVTGRNLRWTMKDVLSIVNINMCKFNESGKSSLGL